MKSLRDAQYGDVFVYRDSAGEIALRVMFVNWSADALGLRPIMLYVNTTDEDRLGINNSDVAAAITSLGFTNVAMWECVDE